MYRKEKASGVPSFADVRRSETVSHGPSRRKLDVSSNYSKEYSQYWTASSRNKDSNFFVERNAYSFANGEDFSPLKSDRGYAQFVSPFSKS
ncbi:unnamed protein product [Heligmosomoides polygyrus]|uniref:HDNR domain-containing protein n=1 Tax=Heligmosomoides polygyrus TaxID=6339 RepID=A0A183FL99_HELPZ|nr:unnamed protein product [Heligmosomoides polygyrus]